MKAASEAWLETRRKVVDAALERFLPSAPAAPAGLAEAMRYSVMAGGKRLRPLLAIASAEAVAAQVGLAEQAACDLALPAACALEFIHTYSLVHDDLPAMDNDTLRRGRPTAHVAFGEGQAILSGDALHTEAFTLMAREPRPGSVTVPDDALAARKLKAIEIVAEAAGAAGMAGGQALDLEAIAAGSVGLDAAALRAMHERKTGALIRASALVGAVMAGAPPALIGAIDVYGSQLGPRLSDRRRHPRRRRRIRRARQNGREGLGRREADLPVRLRPGRIAPAGGSLRRSRARRPRGRRAGRSPPSHRAVGGGPHELTTRARLDALLVERGLAPSRERARAIVLAGIGASRRNRGDESGRPGRSGVRRRGGRARPPLRRPRRAQARSRPGRLPYRRRRTARARHRRLDRWVHRSAPRSAARRSSSRSTSAADNWIGSSAPTRASSCASA